MNPNCLYHNPYSKKDCQRCGSKLLLADRYRAVRQIGVGGFARTFEAVDEHRLNSSCVIKQFYPQHQSHKTYQKYLNLFQQEAQILKNLGQHPRIPALLAFVEQEERFYIVQEFIEGLDLFQELKACGVFSEQKIRQILVELLPVLQFVHERRVIHRDIKPSNIIRQPDNSLVLIDFGGSHLLDASSSLADSPIAITRTYAAPEQERGIASAASDLYSLALTCVRLLTGCFPAENELDPLFAVNPKHCQWQERGVEVSFVLESVLEKMLQWQARDRFQSADEVLDALERERVGGAGEAGEAGDVGAILLRPTAGGEYILNREVEREIIVLASDFSKLEDLLAAGKYEEADRETWNLMLRIARREREGCLNINAIEQFPCQDLRTIDRIWYNYSEGRFGFSIQKQIYQSLGGTRGFDYEIWKQYGDRVSWHVGKHWLDYRKLTFALSAPSGHLPAFCADVLNRAGVTRGVCGWWRLGFVALIHRLDECDCENEPFFGYKEEINQNFHRLADGILS